MKNYLLWLCAMAILGCDNRLMETLGLTSSEKNPPPELNEPFSLPIGKTVTFENEGLSIRFESVPTESRCPAGALCIWEGEAVAKLQMTKSGMGSTTIELNTTQPHITVFFSYTVELLELTPYPVLDQQLDTAAYQALLVVKRVTAH
jgi:hypothetical protein